MTFNSDCCTIKPKKDERNRAMLKSTFSKYLTAFILIILISFLILSGIITSMIKTYAAEDKEYKLCSTSNAISFHVAEDEIEKLENYVHIISGKIVSPFINSDPMLDVIVTDSEGKILLTTVNSEAGSDGMRVPEIFGELGSVDYNLFSEKTTTIDKHDINYLLHNGTIGSVTKEPSIACATPIITKGILRGYVTCLYSTAAEDNLISITRRAVINSSAWVMLAAVIAVYFITERIIHPLRNMTSAAKKFAKGDFSTRVTVYGEDEVAELGNAFNNMAESLENLEKMRASFLASISHDLRTPMTTISGFIDGINSGAIPPEKHEYYLGVISAEVHRLSRLVSTLLDVSRLESGDRKFNFTDFDIAELSRIILISFEQKIDDKKLDVEFESDNSSMFVNADKDAIHQVIYNLCHNAIKFSKEGGKFRIRISRTAERKILVSVFDEGEVISKEDQSMIFERFYKTDKSRGIDKSGVGLGLYISKTIVEAHGEKINVESREGYGTEFYFTLKEGEQPKRK